MYLITLSGKCRPFCLGLNVLNFLVELVEPRAGVFASTGLSSLSPPETVTVTASGWARGDLLAGVLTPRFGSQSLDADVLRLFYSTWPSSFSSHIKKELLSNRGESDGGHGIKRALYIGIRRLWFGCS